MIISSHNCYHEKLDAHYFQNEYHSVYAFFITFVSSKKRISIGPELKTILKGLKLVVEQEGTLHRQKPCQKWEGLFPFFIPSAPFNH